MAIFCRPTRAVFGAMLVMSSMATKAGWAQEQESPIHSLARTIGIATDVAPPPDFVAASRPTEPLTPVPVFGIPVEPPSEVKSPRDLKTMDADLESSSKKHDALRSAFPPSAKAMAEAEAKKAQSKKKPRPMPAKPAL